VSTEHTQSLQKNSGLDAAAAANEGVESHVRAIDSALIRIRTTIMQPAFLLASRVRASYKRKLPRSCARATCVCRTDAALFIRNAGSQTVLDAKMRRLARARSGFSARHRASSRAVRVVAHVFHRVATHVVVWPASPSTTEPHCAESEVSASAHRLQPRPP
jgi:hypothetical protein